MKNVCICMLAGTVLLVGGCAATGNKTVFRKGAVFQDAVAVWQMGQEQGSDIKVNGNVRVGVELQGAEKQASLVRGGDGKVAVFEGGYLIAGQEDLFSSLDGSKTMTLCMRIRDPKGSWDSFLMAVNDPNSELANILYSTKLNPEAVAFEESKRIKSGKKLEFSWRTSLEGRKLGNWGATPPFYKGFLRFGAPVELIGPEDWHDVIIRFTGPRLEMFIDGVLVDEEWPHGGLYGFKAPLLVGAGYHEGRLITEFRGQIDHVAIWNRALSDAEIEKLSGGKKQVAKRDIEIFGPNRIRGQYWRPRGYNTFAGDVMMSNIRGRLHLFYLYDRRHHGSKWGSGAHQFGHMSTTDLVNWQEHPMALPITDQTECSLGTGCCVFRDGIYYLYYIQHGRRILFDDAPYLSDDIFVATSKDGINFTKHPEPVVRLNYDKGGDINPHVITAESGDRYFMTISGWKVYSSENLMDWEEVDMPQLSSIKWICTTNFKWNNWRYFTGWCSYVMSEEPIEDTKEWITPSSDALRDNLWVPAVCEFKGRYIYAGFGGSSWGNELVFRELVQEDDGTLSMKWPEEMIPKSGKPLDLSFKPVKGEVAIGDNSVRVSAKDGFACAMLTGIPQNVRITLRAKPQDGVLHFGLCVRGKGAYDEGCELRFDPAGKSMLYDRPVNGESSKDSKGKVATDTLAWLGKELTIDLIVKNDLVDACVDNRRTLITRYPGNGDRLFFFVTNGEVTFDDIQVRPLLPKPASR